jgi:CheY-like chemotaxis protein
LKPLSQENNIKIYPIENINNNKNLNPINSTANTTFDNDDNDNNNIISISNKKNNEMNQKIENKIENHSSNIIENNSFSCATFKSNSSDKVIDNENNKHRYALSAFTKQSEFHSENNLVYLNNDSYSNSNSVKTNVTNSSKKIFEYKIKALVVEDTILVQKMLSRWLNINNCEVVCANNGKIGFDFLKKLKFDIVLCDFLMVCFFITYF